MPRDWPSRLRLVIFGHSHRPEMEWRGRCLLLNPGACGARRFTLPLTIAILTIVEGRLVPRKSLPIFRLYPFSMAQMANQ